MKAPPSTEDERDAAANRSIDLVVRLNHGPPEGWPLLWLGKGRRDLLDEEGAGHILDAIQAGRSVPAHNVAAALYRLAQWGLQRTRIPQVLRQLPAGTVSPEDAAMILMRCAP